MNGPGFLLRLFLQISNQPLFAASTFGSLQDRVFEERRRLVRHALWATLAGVRGLSREQSCSLQPRQWVLGH